MINVTTNQTALFLDFDGTVVDFASSPDAVEVPPELTMLLNKLLAHLNGAIAIVTGREHRALSALINVQRMVCACEHGSDIVLPESMHEQDLNIGRAQLDAQQISEVRVLVKKFAQEQGLRSESKNSSVTLHYRNKPELEPQVFVFADSLLSQCPNFHLLKGKCVIELRFDAMNKGTAIDTLMQIHPFAGRTPVFIGDDVTDEHGFVVVNHLQGISIKVGEGETSALHRLASIHNVHAFLSQIVQTGEVKL